MKESKKIAVVTGAGRGIGTAIVERLIRDGYFLIAVDKDPSSGVLLNKKFGKEKLSFDTVDISQEAEVQLFFKKIKKYMRLDVLVNNAGIISDNMIWRMPVADFDKVINVNLRGTWLMCKEASEVMRKQGSGRIVNIASRAWLGNKGQSNYSASKAAVVSLTRVLALELGKYNVCVNCVAPGLIDTPLTSGLEKEVLNKLIEAQPTGRMGKPQHIAHVVAFLASEETQFITGQTIYVDGGKSIGAGV